MTNNNQGNTEPSPAMAEVLPHKHQTRLVPRAPFHFDATLHKPDHFPSGDNRWEPGVRWQTARWQGEPLGLRLANAGSVDEPAIDLTVWSRRALDAPFLNSLAHEMRYRLNLDLDLEPFNARFAGDPQLGPVISRWRGMRPAHFGSLYDYLIVAIVLQNTVIRRSIAMMQALYERYGTPLSFDGVELYAMWPPDAMDGVSEEELRALKLGYRAKAIKRVSEALAKSQAYEFALRSASAAEQRAVLLRLYGVGPASVWYILFDVFHRLDELNHISPWEQRIYSHLFFGCCGDEPVPVETLLSLLQDRFGEYRMLAVHYIWEDLFWRREREQIPWLEGLIRR